MSLQVVTNCRIVCFGCLYRSLHVARNSSILGLWGVYMSLQVVTNCRILGFWGYVCGGKWLQIVELLVFVW